MGTIAIRLDHLGKKYHIGAVQRQNLTFRELLVNTAFAPLRRGRNLLRGLVPADSGQQFWALKDVSFEIRHGEVVGIIGRNGAGKSTLLKILSQITEPSSGYVDIYGRIGALLEVGTGFHSELTGRENIYLNGAILGMSRSEIDRKFDEIVDFSGVELFLDTPVKHYSSGMGLRLGFAVAAHLEPDILIVDEVLAVGDAEFQKKCLGRMSDVAKDGRTVMFVSHNMVAINQLCSRAILLNNGQMTLDGGVQDVINAYLLMNKKNVGLVSLVDRKDRNGAGKVLLTEIAIIDDDLCPVSEILAGSSATFKVGFAVQWQNEVRDLSVSLRIEDSFGQFLFTLASIFTGPRFDVLPSAGHLICRVPSIPLVEGEYTIYASLYVGDTRMDAIENALRFNVHSSNVYGTGRFPYSKKHGSFFVEHSWEFQQHSEPLE